MSGEAGVRRTAAAHPERQSGHAAERAAEPPATDPTHVLHPATGPIPVEEAPLDPRAIARASLDAARNVSLWWTSSGIVVATVVALAVGTRAGAFVLAGVALASAVVRAVLPNPGPVAITVRAKALDVAVLAFAGLSIAALAWLLPR